MPDVSNTLDVILSPGLSLSWVSAVNRKVTSVLNQDATLCQMIREIFKRMFWRKFCRHAASPPRRQCTGNAFGQNEENPPFMSLGLIPLLLHVSDGPTRASPQEVCLPLGVAQWGRQLRSLWTTNTAVRDKGARSRSRVHGACCQTHSIRLHFPVPKQEQPGSVCSVRVKVCQICHNHSRSCPQMSHRQLMWGQ